MVLLYRITRLICFESLMTLKSINNKIIVFLNEYKNCSGAK